MRYHVVLPVAQVPEVGTLLARIAATGYSIKIKNKYIYILRCTANQHTATATSAESIILLAFYSFYTENAVEFLI